ncbi:MAG: TonB-dependent receptor [Candidatus Scalindua sp.]
MEKSRPKSDRKCYEIFLMRIKIIVLVLFAEIVLNLTPIFSEEVSMTSEGAESIQEEISDRNRLPDAPVHKANFGVNMGLTKYANANLHTFLSGPRPRDDGDTRADLPSYALVNLTLIGKNFMDNFEIRGSAFNLFDKGYDDPAFPNKVPTDHPQPGRSFMVELRYEF